MELETSSTRSWSGPRTTGVVVAIHKTIPLGPVPMESFRVDDLDAAFIAYPDLPIAIVHGGFASSRTRR